MIRTASALARPALATIVIATGLLSLPATASAVSRPAGHIVSASGLVSGSSVGTPAASTTNLALSATTINAGVDTLTATATVTDTSSTAAVTAGSVQFKVDGTPIGNPVNVATTSGVATLVIPTVGLAYSAPGGTPHAVTADYTDGTTWAASTSSSASFSLIGFGTDAQNIQTSIPAGTLDLTTSLTFSTPLLVPALTITPTANEYFSSLDIAGLSFTDTRPGALPYTMSAIATNLTKQGVANPGVNETISAQDIGLNINGLVSTNASPATFLGSQAPGYTPCAPASSTCTNFTGYDNAAAAHVQATDPGSLGLGGASPHPIIHANSGLGTSVFRAILQIRAPTNILDGTYKGTVTFSIVGS